MDVHDIETTAFPNGTSVGSHHSAQRTMGGLALGAIFGEKVLLLHWEEKEEKQTKKKKDAPRDMYESVGGVDFCGISD